jgi:hypothetical protein
MEQLTNLILELAEVPARLSAIRAQGIVFFAVELSLLGMLLVSVIWLDRRIREIKTLLISRPQQQNQTAT